MGAPHALALTDAVWRGELWRLWSGHIVHYSAIHALLNLAALVPPVVFAPSRRRLLLAAIAVAPLLSLLLLALTTFDEYRGASGLAVAAWTFVAVGLLGQRQPRIGVIMMLGVTLKLALEMSGQMPWSAGVESSAAAHYLGAGLGMAAAVPSWIRRTG